MLLPSLQVSESKWSKSLDGKAKTSLLRGMVIRIFNKWSSVNKHAIVLDDAQWLDPASLEIVQEMIEHCPNLLMLICSRPITESMPDALQKISKSTKCQKYSLSGLTIEEVEEFMVVKLKRFNVLSIDLDLLKEIFNRTKGSPLFADHIVVTLSENIGDAYEVDERGALSAKDKDNIESLLLSGIDAGIRSQFDRLELAFQKILRVASVFGQYFYLEDVMAINGSESTVQEIVEIIEKLDVYGYLNVMHQINFDEGSLEGQTTHHEEAEQALQTWCSFRHISITNTIYDSMPFSNRVELHGEIAEMFENVADAQQRRQELLPMIGFHYARSDLFEKKVDVLEELSLMYLETCDYVACHNTLESLIRFADENHNELLSKYGRVKADEIQIGKRRAFWFSVIAESYSNLYSFKNARTAAFEAFKILNVADVESPKILKKEMKRSLVLQLILLMKTKRGMKLLRKEKRGRYGQIIQDPKIPTLDENIKYHAHMALIIVSLYDDSVSKDFTGWVLFEMANAIIPTAAVRPFEWGRLCARAAFGLYLTSRGLSEWSEAKKYAEISLNYAKLAPSPAVKQLPNGVKSMLMVLQPETSEAFLLSLEPVAVACETFDKGLVGIMGGILEASFACCLCLIRLSTMSMFERFGDAEKTRFVIAGKRLQTVTKRLGVVRKVGFMFICWQMVELCIEIALQHGHPFKLKWWKQLRKSLERDSKKKALLQTMPTINGFVTLMLGAFAPTKTLAKQYLEASIKCHEDFGGTGLAAAISNSMYMKDQ
ncbi:hypothetical protein HDU97_008108 [Phlyctochytrium planicorne]|nr:hypothetical protein HDU97_008108 [Phlyctochytrium planicorne]